MSNFSYSNSNLSHRRIGNWLLLEKLGSGFSGECQVLSTTLRFMANLGYGHMFEVDLTVRNTQGPSTEPSMCIPNRNRSLL